MAHFQNKVNLYPAIGAPGAFASVNPVVNPALGRVAGADIPIGGFCWDSTTVDGEVLATGTGKPLGFVAREIAYPIVDVMTGEQNFVPEGYPVSVQIRGDFYVQVAASVTKGQKVFAVLATGAVTSGAAGATVSGAVETDWFYTADAAADDVVIISHE